MIDRHKKAVFLDRDGTIIVDKHYLSDPREVVLLPNAARALLKLRESGFLLFLFTNQSGVGRGMYPMENVHLCNDRMIELLGLGRPLFHDICIAPEHPEAPAIYRKPSPRFINECILKYDLNQTRCWMVGDKQADVETGVNAGINSALVGNTEPHPLAGGILYYTGLYEFALAVTNDVS